MSAWRYRAPKPGMSAEELADFFGYDEMPEHIPGDPVTIQKLLDSWELGDIYDPARSVGDLSDRDLKEGL